jgi:hypothetical protein
MKRGAIITGLGVCLCSSFAFAWEPRDVKPVAELQGMSDNDLNHEAEQACLGAVAARQLADELDAKAQGVEASQARRKSLIATDYLEVVMRVARAKHQGREPKRIADYQKAARGTELRSCHDISRKRLRKK